MADSDSDSWVMADSDSWVMADSDSWVMADLESDDQEKMEVDFCLIKIEDDSESGAEESSDELPILSFKSTPESPEAYARSPMLTNMKKEVRIEDVLRDHVLHFLPAKTLYPSFISFNQDAYGMPDPSLKFLPEPVNIRTSCNGLLCCQSVGDNVYYICNPVTKQWKMLPRPNMYHGAEAAMVLVFEPHPLNFNETYELVCAVTFPDHPVVYFEIYSSRSSSWRVSDTICCELDCLDLFSGGYYMKGVVYWKASSGVILAFNLRNEQYGILPLPLSSREYGALTVMHGELCYILPCLIFDKYNIYIYGNMDMRLKTVLQFTCDDVGSTYGVCRALPGANDDILMLVLGTRVIAYHVREQKLEVICTMTADSCTGYLPYVNSLVSVRDPMVGVSA
ncbi:F-box family protein, putative isoform 2 [Theobroma cacao]|uniref:F-box family protein, putative isoform 2 n=1 Tax=Theobroma cacao TaxID=3641 RepID=A0A061DFS9_THECC|nr:F-box family protein, putative isoform 2 [Theobroma cacao]